MDRIRIRRSIRYSIISYLPDVIKGEILNIGLIMNIPETGELRYFILNSKNSKFRAVWHNKIDEKIYKIGSDTIDFLLKSIDDNELAVGLSPSSDIFIEEFIKSHLPKGFVFSNVRYAKSSNYDALFQSILEEYIGIKFLNEDIGTNSMVVKKKAIQLIEKNDNLIGVIKKNIKIKPIKELSKTYTIDFGYATNQKIGLIQTAPDKKSSAYDWLERMNFITDNYRDAEKFTMLYNSKAENNSDGTLLQMINYLCDKDDRIIPFDIFTPSGEQNFVDELTYIEKNAQHQDNLEILLA